MLRIIILLATTALLAGCNTVTKNENSAPSPSAGESFPFHDPSSLVRLCDRLIKTGAVKLEGGVMISAWSPEEIKRRLRPDNLQLMSIELPTDLTSMEKPFIDAKTVTLTYLVRDTIESEKGNVGERSTLKYRALWIRISRDGKYEYSGFSEVSGVSITSH